MKLTPPPIYSFLGFNTQGDIGPFTTYHSARQDQVWFLATSPKMPASSRQHHQRNRFKIIAFKWNAMHANQRKNWTTAANRARLRISGYNLFTYTLSRADLEPARTISHQTGLTLTIDGHAI